MNKVLALFRDDYVEADIIATTDLFIGLEYFRKGKFIVVFLENPNPNCSTKLPSKWKDERHKVLYCLLEAESAVEIPATNLASREKRVAWIKIRKGRLMASIGGYQWSPVEIQKGRYTFFWEENYLEDPEETSCSRGLEKYILEIEVK